MIHNGSEVKKFFATVSEFEEVVSSSENKREQALSRQKKLIDSLEKDLQALSKQKLGSLASEIKKVAESIEKTVGIINQSTEAMERRLQLQESYKNRLIILVFGKVNSGKSSFSNYFFSLFPPENLSETPYFFFENGKKEYTHEPFKVGSTETTARIQGVELGKLVLLDTPGLHSITEKNGDLTKNYTDSADLILWLTGSNSPGQTQELEELIAELKKDKVLFPVITKSDKTEDDSEVKNGIEELVQKLVMKPTIAQKAQQDDVYKRAETKLGEMKVDKKPLHPVSISTHYAKEYSEQEQSGISALFAGLNGIYDLAIESKKGNVRTQVRNHLHEINKHLTENIEQPFNALKETLKMQKSDIQKQSGYIATMALNVATNKLPSLIDKHSRNKDIKTLNAAINQVVIDEVNNQLHDVFEALFKSLLQAVKPPKNIAIDIQSKFEDDTINYEFKSGSYKKTMASGAGAAGGAAIGFAVAGPIGAAIGGVIGGAAGDKAGDYLVESKNVVEVVGVDSSKVEAELRRELSQKSPKLVQDSITALLNQFEPLEKIIEQSLLEIQEFKHLGEKI
jgi:predicted GTPase